MDWTNEYLIALYNALIIPIVIFGVGLIVEEVSGIITSVIAMFLGSNVAFFIRNRLTFIGTVHHELAHAIFAVVSGAKVTKVELFHVRGNQLGCVEFRPRGNKFCQAIQLTLSSIAPVVCGAISLCVLSWVWRYRCSVNWQFILVGYLFISVLFHMNMSPQDIKNAMRGMPVTIFICYLAFLFTGVSII